MEFTGDVVIKFLGLDQSKYQWALDEIAREKQRIEELKALKEERRLLELELEMERQEKLADSLEGGKEEGEGAASPRVQHVIREHSI